MGNETGKADFSDVQGGVLTAPATKAESIRADFSDVKSQIGSTVDKATIYTVAAGDNLSKIAKHFYGSANGWKEIFDANRDQLSDPDHIQPGQMLKIPNHP